MIDLSVEIKRSEDGLWYTISDSLTTDILLYIYLYSDIADKTVVKPIVFNVSPEKGNLESSQM